MASKKNNLTASSLFPMLMLVFILCGFHTYGQDSTDTKQHLELLHQADSLMASYKFEKALQILATSDVEDLAILLRIGQCQYRLGASEAAIIPYERVLLLDSANSTALNQLGQLYARKGDYEKAMESYRVLVHQDAENSYYSKQVGLMASRAGDKMYGIKWLSKALVLNPSDTEASLALGTILLDFQNYVLVDSIVREALVLEPSFKPLLVLKAKSAFEQKKYSEVIPVVNDLVEQSDTTALYARLLGVSYFHLGEYRNVITYMTYLLGNNYDYDWIYYYMGIASRELGDHPVAIDWFKLAAQKSMSDNTRIYYSQLGQSYEDVGDYQRAIGAYRAAYNYSKEGILLYHLARNYDVYYKDKATALTYYQKYLESDDTTRLAKEYAKKRVQDMGIF